MKKLKSFLPKALYILGWLGILLGLVRLIEGLTGGYFTSSSILNYAAGVLGTLGSALLYMAAARVVELLEKRNDGEL